VKTLHCADALFVVNSSSSSILSNHGLGPDSTESGPRPGAPDVQMNWLSRFLHIKPASKTLCFHVGRGKVRGDLVRLLRDWQRFGVRDVTFDRTANTINARVDKMNRKSPSSIQLLFSEWMLDGFCFRLDMLEVESVFRCNCTLCSHANPAFVALLS
jgi:serine/threonine-protein kinase HSL1 (negative regulator of Swe1 kinase)